MVANCDVESLLPLQRVGEYQRWPRKRCSVAELRVKGGTAMEGHVVLLFSFFSVQADVAVLERGIIAVRTMLHRGNNVA